MAKASRRTYQDEYLQIIRKLKGDAAGRKATDEYLFDSYAKMVGDLHWATNPYILDAKQYEALSQAAATMGSIMEKVMFKYHRDRSFRSLFGLPHPIEELTLVPSGCHAAVPLSRIDVFFDPKTCDFKIGGIVTGGIDGMVTSTEISSALVNTEAFRTFAARHKNVEVTDPMSACVNTIMHTYGKWANAAVGRNHPTHPSLAIVDVPGSERLVETRAILEVMHELGCYARSTDFSQLRIEEVGGNRQLVDNHGPVTCVWLRATANEVAYDQSDGLRALVRATRRGWVCTVGGYRSWPCCTRNFMAVLRTRDCRALLTKEENDFIEAHIPPMHMIDPSSDLSEFFDQENWAIKTSDGHGLYSAIAGGGMSKRDWRNRLVKTIKNREGLQAYIEQHPMVIAHADENGVPVESTKNVMLGLYVFESRLSGLSAICGTGLTRSDWDDLLSMGCIVVRD